MENTVMVKRAAVITGLENDSLKNTSIVIRNGVIEALCPGGSLEEQNFIKSSKEVDANGLTILPGLINAHEHLVFRRCVRPTPEQMKASSETLLLTAVRSAVHSLCQGITTVRDMGDKYGVVSVLKKWVKEGRLSGPQILGCGSPISITGGHGSWSVSIEADGTDEVRKIVRQQLKEGADFIKVIASHDPTPVSIQGCYSVPEMTREEIQVALDEAHRAGKKTDAHCMGPRALANVIAADVDCIQHGMYLTDQLAASMTKKGIFLVPTMSAYQRQTLHPRWGRGSEHIRLHSYLIEPNRESTMIALQAGVAIGIGTDSLGDYVEELEILAEMGVKAIEVIRSATQVNARILGLEDRIGIIKPGMQADLLAVEGKPLEDISTIRKVKWVMKQGVLYDINGLAQAVPDRDGLFTNY